MSGVDPRVAATMREPGGVTGRAATERGTSPYKPKKINVTTHRGSCKGRPPAGHYKSKNSTELGYPPDKRTRREATIAEKSNPKMDAGEGNPPAAKGQGGGTHWPAPDYQAGGDRARAIANPKRVKTAADLWPDILLNFDLRADKAHQKAKVKMLQILEKDRAAEQAG